MKVDPEKGSITIRPERVGDVARIAGVVRRAYVDVAYSDHREHLMVARLRRTGAYLSYLSLLAEVGGGAIGHVLLTSAQIRGGDEAVDTLALAPLSVIPTLQGQGVKRRLVEAAHRRTRASGFGSVVVIGAPAYYARFGYEPLSRYPVTLPVAAPDEQCMILPLRPGALVGVAGRVAYAPGWLDH